MSLDPHMGSLTRLLSEAKRFYCGQAPYLLTALWGPVGCSEAGSKVKSWQNGGTRRDLSADRCNS